MMKMTSAYANKLLKQLEEDKEFWLKKERESCTYDAAEGEEPVIPEYDYSYVAGEIEKIDKKMCTIKHALNLSNVTAAITVGEEVLSVDSILVKMAQLNRRKAMLDYMRKLQPKERLQLRATSARSAVPEYRYINFDLELVKKEYEDISEQIMVMQIALDKHNQTVEFEVEI
ncbi:MAG: hypothetical protein IJZ82_01175 [Lachnospiraceae bacterium]|nr:hypothetical protein [Lachnospiraceae bacterium]